MFTASIERRKMSYSSKFLSATLCILFTATFSTGLTSADEIAVNGGFETGDFSGWTQFESSPGQQNITNINPSTGTFAAEIFNAVEASNSFIRNTNLGAGIITAGLPVTVSFDARGSYGIGGVAFAVLYSEVAGGGISNTELLGGASLAINSDENVWTSFSFTTTLGSDVSGGVTLELGATNGAVANESTRMFYDNISIQTATTVPEPTSAGLIALAVIGFAQRRRRA